MEIFFHLEMSKVACFLLVLIVLFYSLIKSTNFLFFSFLFSLFGHTMWPVGS